MSLDFNVSAIENHEDVTTAPYPSVSGGARWHPVTEMLVWWSIPCGYNHIGADNIEKVWERIGRYQAIVGPALCKGGGGDLALTRHDVEMHIGLRTNASKKTDKEFLDMLVDSLDRIAKRYPTDPEKSAMHTIGWRNHPGTEEEAA